MCGIPGERSIPTCVGPALKQGRLGTLAPVHPHVRGACLVGGLFDVGGRGPSPRAWGLPCSPDHLMVDGRSIPTCVGPAWIPTDRATCEIGPSPRAWGLPCPVRRCGVLSRSIPTCVGPALNDLLKRTQLPFLNQKPPTCTLTRNQVITKSAMALDYSSVRVASASGSANSWGFIWTNWIPS